VVEENRSLKLGVKKFLFLENDLFVLFGFKGFIDGYIDTLVGNDSGFVSGVVVAGRFHNLSFFFNG
jgi:hypothetical protein